MMSRECSGILTKLPIDKFNKKSYNYKAQSGYSAVW